MISKLPRWIWAGAWALAYVGGFVNAIGYLGFEHQAVTHLTGTTSQLAIAVAALKWLVILHLAAVLGSFLLGTVVSGFLIQDSTLQLGRRYGVALLLESILLGIAVPLLKRQSGYGVYCASCACGLQNAMVSTYSGSVIRTTHLSGMFTDLGIFLGHSLRGLAVDTRRVRLCFLIISGFLVGGIAGALAFHQFSYSALFIPSGLTASTALAYAAYRIRNRHRAPNNAHPS